MPVTVITPNPIANVSAKISSLYTIRATPDKKNTAKAIQKVINTRCMGLGF